MAFTAEEESVLKQVATAFHNAKRLQDLPEVSGGSNPFDLVTEVLDTDGESKQARLAAFLPYAEETCAYGVQLDTTISATTLPRIGNSDLHRSLPVQSLMRGCLLNDDGSVNKYLNPAEWLSAQRDGSEGQVMVEIPMHYRHFKTNGNKREVRISLYPLPGYHKVPKMYISAYEATVNRTTNTLASVVNDTAEYRGGGNQSAWDNTYRSVLGRPATAISRTNFRNYARKRKAGSTEWNEYVYEAHKTLYWLFVIEYANLNCQSAYNPELTSEGYHQGGLGDGVTTWNGDWNTFNGYNPFVPCGHTDEYGNGTGVKDYSVTNEAGTVLKTFAVPRYRGIENPFGHIWKWTDGINIRISPNAPTGDGLSKVFVCNDPSKFSDTGYADYVHVGNEARTEGYVKAIIFGEWGDIMPTAIGGGATSWFCDYHYTNIPTAETLRGVLFGGYAHVGAYSGFAFASSADAPSHTAADIGSRLCFLPDIA